MEDDFRAGDWLVQRRFNRIQGPQGEVTVERKAIKVLVCLAEHAGEVVGREELIQEVWTDAFVTDDVLHHAISELRKAFGESADSGRDRFSPGRFQDR